MNSKSLLKRLVVFEYFLYNVEENQTTKHLKKLCDIIRLFFYNY